MDIIKKAEAVLFAVGRAISEKEISDLIGASPADVHHALVELKKQYESRESPLLVIEEGDAWKLTVHEKYLSIVQGINPHTELSRAILETLAVIAWKQPATQSDVIKIRTNKAYEHIDELEKLGYVSKTKHGRTYLLKVTGKFYDYFDLPKDKGVKEIFKDIKDVEEAVQTKFTEQGEAVGLETYGVKEEIALEKKGKEHVGDLEIFEEVEPQEETSFEETEEIQEEKPAQEEKAQDMIKKLAEGEEISDFLKERKSKPAPQEVEEGLEAAEESSEEPAEEEKEESSEEKEQTEERELSPELEKLVEKKKK
jgi:segregation and condensation protein B